MVCVRCKKRTAVVFIQRMDNGKPVQEGYCLTCAREMHIQPVDDLMKQFGMSDQEPGEHGRTHEQLPAGGCRVRYAAHRSR